MAADETGEGMGRPAEVADSTGVAAPAMAVTAAAGWSSPSSFDARGRFKEVRARDATPIDDGGVEGDFKVGTSERRKRIRFSLNTRKGNGLVAPPAVADAVVVVGPVVSVIAVVEEGG